MGWRDSRQPDRGCLRRGWQGPVDPGRDAQGSARATHRGAHAGQPQAGRHRLLPPVRRGHRPVRRDGVHGLPVLDRVVADLPDRRRGDAERGGPGLLRQGPRRAGEARDHAAGHDQPLRDPVAPGRDLRRMGQPRADRVLRAVRPGPVRPLRQPGEALADVQRDQLGAARPLGQRGDQHAQGPADRVGPVPGDPPRAGRIRAGHADRPRAGARTSRSAAWSWRCRPTR